MERKKIMIGDLTKKKAEGKKITMLTAYDYPTAGAMDEAGIDIILVGDSLGMVVLGYDTTLPVTMDQMISHAQAVRRGAKYAFLIGDMPFMSYQASNEDAVRNAGRFLKEAGCEAVKLEGGIEALDRIKAIVNAGIPVMGHIGLTPQMISKLGGFKVQGKDLKSAQYLLDSAVALEKAGCFSVLFECMPSALAALITKKLSVPTIGIGAGPDCDGQVLVTHDLLGMFERFTPKFAKKYAALSAEMKRAFTEYARDVEGGKFPAEEHCFTMDEAVLKQLK